MKTDHMSITEFTLFVFLVFTAVTHSKARDGTNADLPQLPSSSSSLVGGAVPVISSHLCLLDPYGSGCSHSTPAPIHREIADPYASPHTAAPINRREVNPSSRAVSLTAAEFQSRVLKAKLLRSASRQDDTDFSSASSSQNLGAASDSQNLGAASDSQNLGAASDSQNLGAASDSDSPTSGSRCSESPRSTGSPVYYPALRYTPPAFQESYQSPSNLQMWTGSVVKKCRSVFKKSRSVFRRKKRRDASTSLTGDYVVVEHENDDGYVIVDRVLQSDPT